MAPARVVAAAALLLAAAALLAVEPVAARMHFNQGASQPQCKKITKGKFKVLIHPCMLCC